jgi:RNA polymerase sigma-70 factor, ECF subfamily
LATTDLNAVLIEHFARIQRAALVMTGNPWDADDLAQETFLIYARAGDRFEGRSQLSTWLYGVLLNLERRLRRRGATNRTKLRVLWDQDQHQPRHAPAAEMPVEVAEWKTSLWNYVSQLPEGQRQALVLRFSEQLSYEEIATVLECPLGTVKSRLFHGLASLRDLLQGTDIALHVPEFPQEDISHVS